jgi:hypothetical protein
VSLRIGYTSIEAKGQSGKMETQVPAELLVGSTSFSYALHGGISIVLGAACCTATVLDST